MQKIAIITGGTGYLGSALAAELNRKGWVVAKFSRSSKDFPCDVGDRVSVQKAVQKVVDAYGTVTAVIHAASPRLERVVPTQASRDSIASHQAVAVAGVRNIFTAVQPHMKKEGIFIGITTDAVTSPDVLPLGNYVAAKREMEKFLQEQTATFKIMPFRIGFLPGGLNADLPEFARTFFAAKSEPLDSVVKRIVDLCESAI